MVPGNNLGVKGGAKALVPAIRRLSQLKKLLLHGEWYKRGEDRVCKCMFIMFVGSRGK